jgi:hypothetical protein
MQKPYFCTTILTLKPIRSFFFLWLLWIQPAFSQLRVDDRIGIQEAISRLVGQGVRVSNIRVDCPGKGGRPYGYFTDNTGTLGISDGLIMTTGSARGAIGPNNSGSLGQDNSNDKQDFDLKEIIRNDEKQYDPCVIVFDVEVFADSLTFDYVFGSEEYLEFIKDYHDVFGFFISGPGISGKKNLALVPGTQDPVSVQNINNATNTQFYIDNGTGATPFDQIFVQYDGFTRRLQSKIAVQTCQKYELKFAICDIKDELYDAGIFIAGKSLRTQAPTFSVRYEHAEFSNGIEACNGAFVKITRKSRIAEPITFQLSYSGTANSLDYGPAPDTIRFEAGEKEKEFFISFLADQVLDDNETLKIDLLNPCPGLPQVDQLSILIRESFPYEQPDLVICKGNEIQINPSPLDGYEYSWLLGTGLSCTLCPSPVANPDTSQFYQSTIRHLPSNCQAIDTFEVKVVPIPVAAFVYTTKDDYTSFDIQFQNQSQFSDSFFWKFGDGNSSTEKDPFHGYSIRQEMDSVLYNIELQAISSAGCSDTVFSQVKIGNPFFIPNLLTANGDDLNDAFFVRGIKPGFWHFQVFDAWGKKVYSTDRYLLDWKARQVNGGVYFFKLQNKPGDRNFAGWIKVLK